MPKEITDGYNTLNTKEINEAIEPVAKQLWIYYNKLIEQGFTKHQAIELTKSWQETILTMSKK